MDIHTFKKAKTIQDQIGLYKHILNQCMTDKEKIKHQSSGVHQEEKVHVHLVLTIPSTIFYPVSIKMGEMMDTLIELLSDKINELEDAFNGIVVEPKFKTDEKGSH